MSHAKVSFCSSCLQVKFKGHALEFSCSEEGQPGNEVNFLYLLYLLVHANSLCNVHDPDVLQQNMDADMYSRLAFCYCCT